MYIHIIDARLGPRGGRAAPRFRPARPPFACDPRYRHVVPMLCTMQYYTVLCCTILYYTILYYTILYYTILYYTILYYTTPYCTRID